MVRTIRLAVVGGLAAAAMVVVPVQADAAPGTANRVYRSYSYTPGPAPYARTTARRRARLNGIRDAASKELGTDYSFYAR